jgi:serine/threonine protein kinase
MKDNAADQEDGEISSKSNKIINSNSIHASSIRRVSISQWGTSQADRFEKIELVGEGTFGKVYKARYKLYNTPNQDPQYSKNEIVALKQILMEHEKEGFPITAIREIMILRKLDHENIVKLLDIATSKPSERNKNKGNVYLVFEYLEHDLYGLINRKISYEVSHLKCILLQILTGLLYLHSAHIIHRDLKSANILLTSKGVVKIADFGLARILSNSSNTQYTNRVVTLWYRAPELLLGLSVTKDRTSITKR